MGGCVRPMHKTRPSVYGSRPVEPPEPLPDRVRRLALLGSHGALNRTDQMRLAADALTLLARVSHEEKEQSREA